jgi:hypothetical protein
MPFSFQLVGNTKKHQSRGFFFFPSLLFQRFATKQKKNTTSLTMYITNWDEFQKAAEEIYTASPEQVYDNCKKC